MEMSRQAPSAPLWPDRICPCATGTFALGHWVDAGSVLRALGLLLLAVSVLLFSSLQWERGGSPFGIRRLQTPGEAAPAQP